MPQKNPKCPKCGGKTKFYKPCPMPTKYGGFDREARCFYICKHGRFGCGHIFIDWAWQRRPKPRKKNGRPS